MALEQIARLRAPSGEVSCPVALTTELSELAAAGYRRVPWGGVEIGGLLVGRRDANGISIEAIQAVDCEHEFGPAFQLSAKEQAALESVLTALAASGRAVLGWYRTTSRDLGLTPEDVELAGRFFAEPWQVTLVIQRGKDLTPRFGLFTRAQTGGSGLTLAGEFVAKSVLDGLKPPGAFAPASAGPSEGNAMIVDGGEPDTPIWALPFRWLRSRGPKAVSSPERSKPERPKPAAPASVPDVRAAGPPSNVTPGPTAPPPEPIEEPKAAANGTGADGLRHLASALRIDDPADADDNAGEPEAAAAAVRPARAPLEVRQTAPVADLDEPYEVTVNVAAVGHLVKPQRAEASSSPDKGKTPLGTGRIDPVSATSNRPPASTRMSDILKKALRAGVSRTGWVQASGLSADPFADSPDPAFYVDLPAHREAIAVLEYGISARKGMLLLTGPAGAGKTIVLDCLADRLKSSRVEFARVVDTIATVNEFYESIAYDLYVPLQSPTKTAIMIALQELAASRAAASSTLAILVDNAHALPADVLEELEVLNNVENRTGKLIQVVLAGQPGLAVTLDQPRHRGLRQRIVLRANLKPLAAADAARYIETRFKIAGGAEPVFAPDVVHAIYRTSGGIPRLINQCCSAAMDRSYLTGEPITVELIETLVKNPQPGEDSL